MYLKACVAVVSNSAETILKLVMNSPDIIGLLPLPAVPLDLTIIPVTLPSLTLDVHLEARKPPILSPPSSAGFSATNFRLSNVKKITCLRLGEDFRG